VGKKFHEDGSARFFPGNTVICHTPRDSESFQVLSQIREECISQPWGHKFAFLPPTSYHTTIFEGVCEEVRNPKKWTSLLPITASLEEVDKLLISKWANIAKPDAFQVKFNFFFITSIIGIRLLPVNENMEVKMRGYRDLLSKEFGIKAPGHNHYGFHTSFAYKLISTSLKENFQILRFMKKMTKKYKIPYGTLTLGAPELTFFADMTQFAPSRNQTT
jgi:hypothetical protein